MRTVLRIHLRRVARSELLLPRDGEVPTATHGNQPMNVTEKKRHLRECIDALAVRPLDATHECGLPIWLLISLCVDAYERAEQGLVG